MKVLYKVGTPMAIIEQRGMEWYCIESWSKEIYVDTNPLINITQYCKEHTEWNVKEITEGEYALIILTCQRQNETW